MKVPAEAPSTTVGLTATAASDLDAMSANVAATGSASQLALVELRRQLAAWTRHESGARLGVDPEELHQLRVAIRRIDALLGIFKQQLPATLVRARKHAKSVLRTLGTARDLDVQLAELERYCASLSPAERLAAIPLRTRLEADRAKARLRMIRALDGEPTRLWREALDSGSAEYAAAAVPGAAPAALVMPVRVGKRYRKLRKDIRRLGSKSVMDEYHVVRRRAKLLRYALEPGAQLFGKPAEEMLRSLRRLQDGLGEHQDAYLAKNRLAALAAAPGAGLPPETLFFMGRLAEHHLHVTTRARKTLRGAWDKIRGRRWKTLRARMAHLSATVAKNQERSPVADAEVLAPPDRSASPELERAPVPESRPLKH